MAHSFAHAYTNVKLAAEGLVAADTLKVSLNRAYRYFMIINDYQFDEDSQLKEDFKRLRSRLSRISIHRVSMISPLEGADDEEMVILAKGVINLFERMGSSEFSSMMSDRPTSGVLVSLKRDPGPDNWDDGRSFE